MRIAQVAPLYESVPPKFYGGTERVVSYLTEELVREGHEVTLFASGDSVTAARLVAPCLKALRLDTECVDKMAHHILLLEHVFSSASEFDIIHFHVDYMHFPLTRRLGIRALTTLHGRLDLPDLVPLYYEYSDMPVVSISDAQRAPLKQARWAGTVYHGLPPNLYSFNPHPEGYFAFIGRISPEKRIDIAIDIAIRLGVPLKIAAKVDPADRVYFATQIEPLLDHPLIEYIGEISEVDKNTFLGNARALLFTVDWPEPFGLAMIEALACGTPVIALRRGSIPEIIEDGVTGFVADGPDAALGAAERVGELDRAECRAAFERRFTCERMAHDYLEIYTALARPRTRALSIVPPLTDAPVLQAAQSLG
ncbi:MAG TPA: glycosyltransferase family 4 protein [Gammaproteobacteria bacterium]|jgi:glycosyltransferase involved in cell wall biosynthesis|nr:glycosyltransferase family 4 protein [Gammaproteobacteria bacterium]